VSLLLFFFFVAEHATNYELNYVPHVPHVPLKNYVPICLVNKTKTRNPIFRFFEEMLRFE